MEFFCELLEAECCHCSPADRGISDGVEGGSLVFLTGFDGRVLAVLACESTPVAGKRLSLRCPWACTSLSGCCVMKA